MRLAEFGQRRGEEVGELERVAAIDDADERSRQAPFGAHCRQAIRRLRGHDDDGVRDLFDELLEEVER